MFHIHCGYDNPDIETSLILIKYFDAYIGLPSILLDDDNNRRNLYGKAGCFRLCDYGFEYRVLSSMFLRNKSFLTFVWEGIVRALYAYSQGYELPNPDQIQEAINNSNVALAEKIIKKYNINFDISNIDQLSLFEFGDAYVGNNDKGFIGWDAIKLNDAVDRMIKANAHDKDEVDFDEENNRVFAGGGIMEQIIADQVQNDRPIRRANRN
jgi:hypothetical protein